MNGFNSRCLHIITGQDYRVTATVPEYDLLLAIRQRRLRYLGHILRMPESRVVRRALVALAKGLFMDCQTMKIHQLVALAQGAVRGTHWPNNYDETDCHRTIGPPGSEMERIHSLFRPKTACPARTLKYIEMQCAISTISQSRRIRAKTNDRQLPLEGVGSSTIKPVFHGACFGAVSAPTLYAPYPRRVRPYRSKRGVVK